MSTCRRKNASLRKSAAQFESSDFRPQELRNANVDGDPPVAVGGFRVSRRRLPDAEGQRIRPAKFRWLAHTLDLEGRHLCSRRRAQPMARLGLLRGLEASEGANLEAAPWSLAGMAEQL